MTEWHGWRIVDPMSAGPGTSLHVGRVPGRKRVALYLAHTNQYCAQLAPLAWFSNEDDAREAMRLIDLLAHAGERK